VPALDLADGGTYSTMHFPQEDITNTAWLCPLREKRHTFGPSRIVESNLYS
jgi:hypothetical protein